MPEEENPQCHIHDKVENWAVGFYREKVCVNDEPLTKHRDGKNYCIFHLPTQDKDIEKFEEIFWARLNAVEEKIAAVEKSPEEKLEETKGLLYDFSYVWFPSELNLSSYKFQTRVDFYSATFSAYVTFIEAIFTARASFMSATFSDDASFNSAKFTETSQVFFTQTRIYKTIDFNDAVFAGYVAFNGNRDEKVFLNKKEEDQDAVLDLQNARLEKPERISFHRVRLRPSWFVNTDSRKMVFIDVIWENYKPTFDHSNINSELASLKERGVSEPSRLLEIACRQLAVNAEENNRYEEAARFRYMAMETKRLEYEWHGRLWTIHWWYKLSSKYGESWKHAAFVLVGIILFFGLVYWSPVSTFDYGDTFHNMKLGDGLVHSLSVAAFQRPEPKAADAWTKFFIILETIFAPLQAALLALAIRRKFMR